MTIYQRHKQTDRLMTDGRTDGLRASCGKSNNIKQNRISSDNYIILNSNLITSMAQIKQNIGTMIRMATNLRHGLFSNS